MNYSKEETPQRLQSDSLVLEEVRDELMIYDPERNKAFCLNQTAAFVWKHSDGKTTVAEMAGLLRQQLGKPVDERVVWYALDVLSKDGLLALSTVLPAVPAGVTRRSLLQKIGVGAMALPVVTVLMVSPPKAHASSGGSIPSTPENSTSSTTSSSSQHHGGFWAWLENLF